MSATATVSFLAEVPDEASSPDLHAIADEAGSGPLSKYLREITEFRVGERECLFWDEAPLWYGDDGWHPRGPELLIASRENGADSRQAAAVHEDELYPHVRDRVDQIVDHDSIRDAFGFDARQLIAHSWLRTIAWLRGAR